ncbi:MAG: cytochrome c [Cyanothece sp. SIO1E1]|nr:cytochrome c [Cyanothece sp. SIO1E1]
MDNQLASNGIFVKRIAMGILVILCASLLITLGVTQLRVSDPYIREVLALEGSSDVGRTIFQMNCAVCHGLKANGEVGPSLVGISDHRSRVRLIKQVTSGKTPPMPQFQPSPQVMANLLEYLESL